MDATVVVEDRDALVVLLDRIPASVAELEEALDDPLAPGAVLVDDDEPPAAAAGLELSPGWPAAVPGVGFELPR